MVARPPDSALDQPCWRLQAGGPDPLRAVLKRGSEAPVARRLRARRQGARSAGRFSPPELPDVRYLAFQQSTCRAECVHHWSRIIQDTGGWLPRGAVVTGIFRQFQVTGWFADLRAGFDAYQQPDLATYPRCQALARSLAAEGRVDGVAYRSAREAGGTCVAVWRPEAVAPLREGRTVRLVWDGDTLC